MAPVARGDRGVFVDPPRQRGIAGRRIVSGQARCITRLMPSNTLSGDGALIQQLGGWRSPMTRRRCLLVVAAIVVATVTALAIWRPWVKPEPSRSNDLNVNGVAYELPLVADPKDLMAVADELLKARTATGVKWSNGIHTLEVAGGEVLLNGESHGTVK